MAQAPAPQPSPAQMFPTVPQQAPQIPAAPTAAPQVGVNPMQKTMGQGGNMSDADLTRMARSSAITAVMGAAFTPEDFRDAEENVDWMRVYAAAEAVTKFILSRQHQGWQPGVELEAPERPQGSSNEQQVLAEVQAQFGDGLVSQGFAEPQEPLPVAEASSEKAEGGEFPWDG
jgi:hypothetical protein